MTNHRKVPGWLRNQMNKIHLTGNQIWSLQLKLPHFHMSRCRYLLTHCGRDKMVAIFQTSSSNAFSWMKMYKFLLGFHWRLLLRVQMTIFQHWFRQWLGVGQTTSHYLNQWWLVYWRIYASLSLNDLRKRRRKLINFTFWPLLFYNDRSY